MMQARMLASNELVFEGNDCLALEEKLESWRTMQRSMPIEIRSLQQWLDCRIKLQHASISSTDLIVASLESNFLSSRTMPRN